MTITLKKIGFNLLLLCLEFRLSYISVTIFCESTIFCIYCFSVNYFFNLCFRVFGGSLLILKVK